MRACDIDMSGDVWLYRPGSDQGPQGQHKTAHRGKQRIIAIGPKAQETIRPFLVLDTQAYLFSPRHAMEQRRVERRALRKSKVQPSQEDRRRPKAKCRPGERYTRSSYYYGIIRACNRADAIARAKAVEQGIPVEEAAKMVFVPHWHPNQLRHTHATEIRRRFGLEAAQCALGHTQANITQIYAERDLGLAVKVALEVG
jgi:integrase